MSNLTRKLTSCLSPTDLSSLFISVTQSISYLPLFKGTILLFNFPLILVDITNLRFWVFKFACIVLFLVFVLVVILQKCAFIYMYPNLILHTPSSSSFSYSKRTSLMSDSLLKTKVICGYFHYYFLETLHSLLDSFTVSYKPRNISC